MSLRQEYIDILFEFQCCIATKAQELKALAEYQDLNKSDKEKVMSILYKKQIEQIDMTCSKLNFFNSKI